LVRDILQETVDRKFHCKVFLHQDALWWDVSAESTTRVDRKVLQQFKEHGTGETRLLQEEGCAVSSTQESTDDCNFRTYNAGSAFQSSTLLRKDMDNGCMADNEAQDHLTRWKCDPNITRSTVDRIHHFTELVHRDKFGLGLPQIARWETVRTQAAGASGLVSWIEGVLPFFTASMRHDTDSKDSDYLAYLLDNEARCRDSYRNQSLSEFACFLDGVGEVQLVVPWLGKDFSFLKLENLLKIFEHPLMSNRDPELQDLDKVEMGTDICRNPDGLTRLSCTATACLDDLYKTYENKTAFCEASAVCNRYYRDEVAKESDRVYMERMHQGNNLFNPMAKHSQCYIKYTPVQQERARNRQCQHMQAPIGYSPSVVRPGVKGAPSLNRSKVSIPATRLQRHVFRAAPARYSALNIWTGDAMPTPTEAEAVSVCVWRVGRVQGTPQCVVFMCVCRQPSTFVPPLFLSLLYPHITRPVCICEQKLLLPACSL